jgi:hypothetical protein
MIIGFTGKQGEGKSYSLVDLACRSYLAKGRDVYSNLAITDPVTGNVARRWDVLEDGFESLYDVRDSLMVLDELPTFLNSRDYSKRGTRRFFALLAQVRKRRNVLVYTAQSFLDCDVYVRRQTHLVARCRVAYRHPWRKDPSGWVNPFTRKVQHVPLVIRQDWMEASDAEVAEVTVSKRRVRHRLMRFRVAYAGAFDSWADVAEVEAAA